MLNQKGKVNITANFKFDYVEDFRISLVFKDKKKIKTHWISVIEIEDKGTYNILLVSFIYFYLDQGYLEFDITREQFNNLEDIIVEFKGAEWWNRC